VDGTSLFCLCPSCRHGYREKLGELRPDGLAIRDTRHGRCHEVNVEPKEILERLAGTTGHEGIINWLKAIYV